MNKDLVLKVVMKNEDTALPRVLRVINRQNLRLNKLFMQVSDDNKALDLYLSLECIKEPLQLLKLLKKQVAVLDVMLHDESAGLTV